MALSQQPASKARRHVEVAAFVAVWMVCGWSARLDTSAYLVLGVPLVLLFQHFVARRPLAALWVRTAPQVTLGPRDVFFACLVTALPAWELVTHALPMRDWTGALWYACAIFGAFGVAFSLRNQQRELAQRALPFVFAAILWQGMALTLAALPRHGAIFSGVKEVMPLLRQFLMYLPALFVLEEVAFRGALDTHIAGIATAPKRSWTSALFVSALWGLWHVPIYPELQNVVGVVGAILVSLPLGMLLSYTWRRGGTLLLPAAVHAAVDAYRNIVLG